MCKFANQEEEGHLKVLGKRKADALIRDGDVEKAMTGAKPMTDGPRSPIRDGDVEKKTTTAMPPCSALKRWKLSSSAHDGGSKNSDPSMYRRPYKKLPSPPSSARGWIETAFRLGVLRPELCLSKRVTRSDACPHQHRFQLTEPDIAASSPFLQDLAAKALDVPPPNGVAVKVLDRMGHIYDLNFKFVDSSGTFRFMGSDYTRLLADSGLTEGQVMDIWVLPNITRGADQYWLAFVNSDDQRIIIQYCTTQITGGAIPPPALRSWNVIC